MRRLCGLSPAFVLFIFLVNAHSFAQTNFISGELSQIANWSGTNVVQGAVTVPAGIVVTISPGARILMDSGASLLIRGQLLADGTEAAPIYFTRRSSGTRWKQITFSAAADSRLKHCVIEFANSEGTHLDYYDNDCNPGTTPPPRNYHEAIVAIATHLDIDGCLFQNLPDSSGTREGDAIAIISDDPVQPGNASAQIRNCRFISIGQGIHTRFSYVLVENCYFTDHHGDNDDIDMYGESTPPPLIRKNLFLNPAHDDMINPTRCSAWIIGNVIAGGDDHGIVLRDKCSPVVINNLVYNCANGGISVQNQCEALLINNTIANCGRGLRLFDHIDRRTPPYCLFPGSGKATVINCLIWDSPTSISLDESPYPEDRGSHVNIRYSIVQGGQASASVSVNSTLTWGPGMLTSDPFFVNTAADNYRLRPGSSALDTGVHPATLLTNILLAITNDFDGMARPLDSNGDGTPAYDIGAYEFLLPSADSNKDSIPDGWVHQYGLNLLDQSLASSNPDNDSMTTLEEWVADTDPTDALSFFRIENVTATQLSNVSFLSSSNRHYTLFFSTNLLDWTNVQGQAAIEGTGGAMSLSDAAAQNRARFYRVEVEIP